MDETVRVWVGRVDGIIVISRAPFEYGNSQAWPVGEEPEWAQALWAFAAMQGVKNPYPILQGDWQFRIMDVPKELYQGN